MRESVMRGWNWSRKAKVAGIGEQSVILRLLERRALFLCGVVFCNKLSFFAKTTSGHEQNKVTSDHSKFFPTFIIVFVIFNPSASSSNNASFICNF